LSLSRGGWPRQAMAITRLRPPCQGRPANFGGQTRRGRLKRKDQAGAPHTPRAVKGAAARAKNNNRHSYLYNWEKRRLNSVYQMNGKRRGKSSRPLSADIGVVHEDFAAGIPAKQVIVRDRADRKKWIAPIPAGTCPTEGRIIELYGLRRDVEPFFKILKPYPRVESESRGRPFDALTAHATIVMTRHTAPPPGNGRLEREELSAACFFAVPRTRRPLHQKPLWRDFGRRKTGDP